MELINLICIAVGFLLVMIGIICTYDARKITDKWFSFNDQNEGAKGLKIGGFILATIGIGIIYFFIKY